MNKFDLKNKTAIITGGAQGFGLDIAKKCNIKINYYEDVYKNKKLIENIKLDLEYFEPYHKLRVSKTKSLL